MQVHSYCRLLVVRTIDAETRKKLFTRLGVTEMSTLRSFLDKPRPRGQTQKGSGQVGYYLNRENSKKIIVQEGSVLEQQVQRTFDS